MSFFGDLLHRFRDEEPEPSIAEKVTEGIRSSIDRVKGSPSGKCPKCRKRLADGKVKFCPGCGYQLRLTCRKCNLDYPLGTEFCLKCGNQLK